MFEGLDELKKAKAEYDAVMKKKGEKVVRASIKEFFTIHPEVKALRWTQYTPYFNDGEPCIFGYSGCDVKLADSEPDAIYACPNHEEIMTASPVKCGKPNCGETTVKLEPDQDNDDGWFDDYSDAIKGSLKTDLRKFNSYMVDCEDALLIAFGDHARITATQKDITIDEYEHD